MKRINKKTVGTLLLTLFLASCSDILKETPRSKYTAEYFKSAQGASSGIASLYASFRNIYGNYFYYAGMQSGTDESTWGSQNNGDAKNDDWSGVGATTSLQNSYAAIWGQFSSINNANGIIENGVAGGVAASLIAEARFFRAFNYFLMVQTYGGVPLDLGSGQLKFNNALITTSVRNTVPDVYTKAIFPDLIQAVTDLPAKSRITGSVNITVAQLILAKAYLTYGWWLENPNNIPTYPDAPRIDPNGQNPAYYYQQAYNIATAAIATHDASIGLETYYYDVNLGSNDRGKEWLLYADHTQSSDVANGSPVNEFGSLASPRNEASWATNFNYINTKSFALATGSPAAPADYKGYKTGQTLQREADQKLGRPFVSVCPTRELLMNIFADKTNDSRYDGTFTTTYYANWKKNPSNAGTNLTYNANLMPVAMGDPILTFLDTDPGTITYSAGTSGADNSGVGAGSIPGRADWVIPISNITRTVFPSLWKIGTYRTDNNGGLGPGVNAGLTRPFPIAKFSELYFVAAEAAAKGATGAQTARDLINVIRARAGMWRYKNNANLPLNPIVDNSAAMIAATPAVVDVNYILDERSREYYGEGFRWFDLVRTQTWATRAASYSVAGINAGERTVTVVNRTIPLGAWLRPIPQNQIDGLTISDADKKAYQNPQYQ
jgi:hypothetical protein